MALGATVIEKHFTLDRNLEGPDHKASLEPQELKQMVVGIRNIEKAISGSGQKEVSKSERKNLKIARKSLFIGAELKKGQTMSDEHLIVLRPGNGLSPMKWKEVVGKKVKKDLSLGHLLTFEDLEI